MQKPAIQRIIQMKSSDNSISHLLKIGNNKITYPKHLQDTSNTSHLIIMLNEEGVWFDTHSDFALLVKYKNKGSNAFLQNRIIFCAKIEDLILYPMISPFSIYFYFNVITYEVVKDLQLPYPNFSVKCDYNSYVLNDRNDINLKLLSFKRDKESDEDECVICLESKAKSAALDKCKHDFCKKCILNWAKSSSECPICKSSFTKIISEGDNPNKIHRIRVKPKQYKYEEMDDRDNWIDNCAETCMICNRGDDNYLMLVCDKCNYNICHTYCDGLDNIPEGNWYCKSCKSRSKAAIKQSKSNKQDSLIKRRSPITKQSSRRNT